jgi:endosialidase-like protein
MKLRVGCVVVGFLSLVLSLAAQTAGGSPASAQVPPVIQFSNLATDAAGTPLTGPVVLAFSLYNHARGGEPLWSESQSVQLDNSGRYSVYLGITKASGVPVSLFSTGQAHWLGVQPLGQPEQPRVFLVSVPYAMKAGDAATIGGLPPSAFVLAAPVSANPPNDGSNAAAGSDAGTSAAVVGSGTTDFVPLWTANSSLGNSVLFQSGTGATAKLGINITSPLTTLDVNGTTLLRGLSEMATVNFATPTKAYNSNPFNFESSAYSSSLAAYTLEHFQWQSEPTGNNTSNPSATLNLLFGIDPAAPAETGLSLNSKGIFTFASSQTFPGTGTITGVTTASGSGLTGGGTSGNLDLSLTNACSNGQVLQWNGSSWVCTSAGTGTITGVTAGIDLTGGGTNGSVTLNLDTTKVPQLNAGNTFSGNQTIDGTGAPGNFGLIVNQPSQTGVLVQGPITGAGAGLDLETTGTGSKQWEILATGNGSSQGVGKLNIRDVSSSTDVLTIDNTDVVNVDTNLEVARNLEVTGTGVLIGGFYLATGSPLTGNVLLGLSGNGTMTGEDNTASGVGALNFNTTGADNTAVGYLALQFNLSGQQNTATGYLALAQNESGCCNTATGNAALYHNSTGYENTAVGEFALNANTTGEGNTGVGYEALLNTNGNELTCIGFLCTAGTDNLSNATAIGAHAVVGSSDSLVLGGTGQYAVKVGIGTTTPSSILTIARGAGHPVSDSWETYSSRRWKTNIQTLPSALAKVEQLRGVSYDLRDSGRHEIGVIAEEVGAVVPEVVSYEENGKDARGVDYSRLTALLIEATKEQQQEIQQEQAANHEQRQEIQQEQTQLGKALRQIKQQQGMLRAQTAAMRSLEAEVRETRETLRRVKAQLAAARPTLVAAK